MVPVITVPLGALKQIFWPVYLKKILGKKRVSFEDSNKLTYSVAPWHGERLGAINLLSLRRKKAFILFG